MTLTPEDRKKLLGHGGLSKVGRMARRTAGHVTEVNSYRRRDAVVERGIMREIVRRHPEIDVTTIWPPHYNGTQQLAHRSGDDLADVSEHTRMISTQGLSDVPSHSGTAGTVPKKSRAIR